MIGDPYKIDFDQTYSKSLLLLFLERGNWDDLAIAPEDNKKTHKVTNKKLGSLLYEELMDNKIQASKAAKAAIIMKQKFGEATCKP